MAVGTLEEIIDDNHAIVASSMGPEYYVTIMSFVNQDLLEPGCSVLLHNKVRLSTCIWKYVVHKYAGCKIRDMPVVVFDTHRLSMVLIAGERCGGYSR